MANDDRVQVLQCRMAQPSACTPHDRTRRGRPEILIDSVQRRQDEGVKMHLISAAAFGHERIVELSGVSSSFVCDRRSCA